MEAWVTFNSITCFTCKFLFFRLHSMTVCSNKFIHWTQSNTIHWIGLNCVQLSLIAEVNKTESDGLGSICSHTKFGVWFRVRCWTQSNSIHGMSLIEFDFWTFDWLHVCWVGCKFLFELLLSDTSKHRQEVIQSRIHNRSQATKQTVPS